MFTVRPFHFTGNASLHLLCLLKLHESVMQCSASTPRSTYASPLCNRPRVSGITCIRYPCLLLFFRNSSLYSNTDTPFAFAKDLIMLATHHRSFASALVLKHTLQGPRPWYARVRFCPAAPSKFLANNRLCLLQADTIPHPRCDESPGPFPIDRPGVLSCRPPNTSLARKQRHVGVT
ncbi:hypothetical protein EDB87DRAFT_304246 [Lactarius vividus]|nr:hypothetical protein EDB87DRAFT_304246 [Lactarius vividus]